MAKNRNHLNYITSEAHDCNLIVDTREIFLHKHKDDDSDVDTYSANNLIKNLRILESQSHKAIIIHQFSFGGCTLSALAMYDAIKSCQSPIIVMTWGTAMSAGSIIPQAADLRITAPNTVWMLHEGSMNVHNSYKETKAWMEWAERDNKLMYDIYAERCVNGQFFKDKGYDVDEVRKFIKRKFDTKADWFINNAREVVSLGLSDCVLGDPGYENIEVIRQIYDK